MSKRTKNAYLWAFEQQDTWDNITDEKITQLDEILDSHLDWFTNHSTVNNLLSWKKPHYDFKRNNVEFNTKDGLASSPQNNGNDKNDINIELIDKSPMMNDKPVDSVDLINDEPVIEEDPKDDKLVDKIDIDLNNDEPVMKDSKDDNQTIMEFENIPIMKEVDDNQIMKEVENSPILEDPMDNDSSMNDNLDVDFVEMDNKQVIDDSRVDVGSKKIDVAVNNKEIHTEDDPSVNKGASSSESQEDSSDEEPVIRDNLKVVIESPSRFIKNPNETGDDKLDEDKNTDLEIVEIRSDESVISIGLSSSNKPNTDDATSSNDRIQAEMPRNSTTNSTIEPTINSNESNISSNVSKQTDITVEPMRPTADPSFEIENMDYDEHEDEIEIVVSRRKSIESTPTKSPVESPIKPPMSPYKKPFTRQQSTFMSKLFRLGRPSVSKLAQDEIPAATITTKRPSTESHNRLKNRSSLTEEQEIEVSDIMPERPFKHPRLLNKKSKEVSNNTLQETKSKQKEEEEDIPSWARYPELDTFLKNQSTLDPDVIFGRLQPYNVKDIFPSK